MPEVEIRQRAALKGQRGDKKGQEPRHGRPICIGLAGTLDQSLHCLHLIQQSV